MVTEQTWRVDVDRRACIGSGICVASAPGHFQLEEGRAVPSLGTAVEPDEVVLDAAESCPAEAIMVRDAASGMVLAPADEPEGAFR